MQDNYNGCFGTKTINVVDSRPQFTLTGIAPTSSVSCNGSITIHHLISEDYSVTSNSGTLNGNTLNNLCYGWVKVCLTDTTTTCVRCDSLLINEATRLKENLPEIKLNIYPNPASSEIYFETNSFDPVYFKLITPEGKLLQSFFVRHNTHFSLLEIPPGLYFLESENQLIRKKLVIIR